MLSRIAESLFWIGRYVERADGTCRILDVHLQVLLEDPWVDEDAAVRSLLTVMGDPIVDDGDSEPTPLTRDDVLARLAFANQPAAIMGAIGEARENARRAREAVSTEVWECLNSTYTYVGNRRRTELNPNRFLAWVRERTAAVAGIADSSMTHDLPWQFMQAGRMIERADMTARLLASRSLAGSNAQPWQVVLRSAGGLESFVTTHRGRFSDEEAAEFMLHDRLFPRSVAFALAEAEAHTQALALSAAGSGNALRRSAVTDEASRIIGSARARIEYEPLESVLADLPNRMIEVQQACSAASDSISQRYFPSQEWTSWQEEAR